MMDSILARLLDLLVLAKVPLGLFLASPYTPFFVIMSIVAFIMYKAHQDSKSLFSMYDLVSQDGKACVEKILMLLGGLSVTWWFIDICAKNKATLDDAIAYGVLLGLAKFANKVLDLKFRGVSVPMPGGATITEKPSDKPADKVDGSGE